MTSFIFILTYIIYYIVDIYDIYQQLDKLKSGMGRDAEIAPGQPHIPR